MGVQEGIKFILPDAVKDKNVSVVEVGPFDETSLAGEINLFLDTGIERLNRINTYLLVHPPEIKGIESLLTGKPFVDPIVHRATLNRSLASELGLSFDYVLQSMLNPGTSDAEGDIALRQMLLALGYQFHEGDIGFYSKQYFLQGDLTSAQLEEVSGFLANPDLNRRLIMPKAEYENGRNVTVPMVTLKTETKVEKYDVLNMDDNELLELSNTRRLAGTLKEMQQFRDMYKDPGFIAKRKEHGLDERATDVELETWFGLRSEHCFHKEFNAHITLDDKVNDPIFTRAAEKGWLKNGKSGIYTLEGGLFKTFIQEPAEAIFNKLEKRGNNWIASMFDDNSGVVFYDKDYMFCIKFETHNSPSNKEPIQGAKTGIDGVNRDIFGTMMGTFDAIANFFFYCTGNPNYKGWLPKGVKHPYTILKGITQGVREGGNEMQIPTLGGGLITDPRYIAKCLVYCGTIGWSPVLSLDGKSYMNKKGNVGDIVFVAGQPVGIDGVHGATESSLIADENISLGHVQADFSFIQAKMKEYILDVARAYLLTTLTDFGAMGLGSSSHEISRDTGGLFMDLAKHPVKYKGIQPWQINCSETQDRMLLVADKSNRDELLSRAELHDVQVTEIGELTDSGFINLKYGGDTVALIDIEKLFNKEPRKYMHATWSGGEAVRPTEIKNNYSLEESLCMVMEQPDVASKEWFFRQKDSSVKGGTILGPLMGQAQEVEADATVQKPVETEGKDFGALAYAMGITPKMSDIDPYHSAQRSFIDMAGKIIAVGGALPDMNNAKWDAWAACGNYCQPNSDSNSTLTKESGEHNLASLVREGIGIRDAIEALNVPIISGKDSMKCSCIYEVDDDFNIEDLPADLRRHIILVEDNGKGKMAIEIHDPDSYLATCAVKIDDYRKCVDSSFKEEGDIIYLIGSTKRHMGASQYNNAVGYKENGAPLEGGRVPRVNLHDFVDAANAIHNSIDDELVASCSYVHNGGVLTAVAKAAMAGEKGGNIGTNLMHDCGKQGCTDEQLLYSETPGRFIVTVAPEDAAKFEEKMEGVLYANIGTVTGESLTVTRKDNSKETINLDKVKVHYQKPLSFGLNDMKK